MERVASRDAPSLPGDLWRRLALAPARLLALDYDGTLAPLRPERHLARPVPGVPASLRAIAALPATSVAVVSGRPVADLARLLFDGDAPGAVTLAGEHGWEWLVSGVPRRVDAPAEALAALEACAGDAAAAGWNDRLERKRTALVLHTRGLDALPAREIEAECERRWRARASDAALLRVDRIDGGVEVRCAGRDKGAVIRELIDAAGAGALAVYAGDDATDEDAFRALGTTGVALRVGSRSASSPATGRFATCGDVAEWLARWPAELARAIRAAPE